MKKPLYSVSFNFADSSGVLHRRIWSFRAKDAADAKKQTFNCLSEQARKTLSNLTIGISDAG